MIRRNLVLLEYMVKKRIEEDSKRLEAIKNVNELLLTADLDMDDLAEEKKVFTLKKLIAIKGRPLNYLELDLIEEIFKVNQQINNNAVGIKTASEYKYL